MSGSMQASITRAAVATLLAIGLAGCANGPVVRSERAPGIELTSYRTFGFFDELGTDRAGYETIVTSTLKASVRREMEARGYRYAANDGELKINFNAKLVDRVAVYPKPDPDVDYYRYRSYTPWVGYRVDVDQYKEGTLNIDVVEAAGMRLVWEGVAVGRVTDKTYRNREAAIDQAVVDIFKSYPVPARP